MARTKNLPDDLPDFNAFGGSVGASLAERYLGHMFAPSDFQQVGEFHKKFKLDSVNENGVGPRAVDEELMQFRIKFLKEELNEFIAGYEGRDIEKQADSLVDLVYVALGTAHLLGLPWPALFAEVQRANLAKERVTKAEDSTRGSTYDVRKPAGWKPPDIVGVLKKAGFTTEPLFIGLPIEEQEKTPLSREQLCADPRCPFLHGPNSKWCPPHEKMHGAR